MSHTIKTFEKAHNGNERKKKKTLDGKGWKQFSSFPIQTVKLWSEKDLILS